MIKEFIKKWLEIEQIENKNSLLENKINLIQKEKSNLENKLIEAEKEKSELSKNIFKSVNSSEINHETGQFLNNLNIQLTDQNKKSILTVLTAKDVVNKYEFKRYDPKTERGYDSQIITFGEFKEHPELYIHKLGKGFLNFPININFNQVNEILFDQFGNISIDSNTMDSNNGTFKLLLSGVISDSYSCGITDSEYQAGLILNQAAQLSHLNLTSHNNKDKWFSIDTLDFISNYEGIKNYILDLPDIKMERKKEVVKALEFTKFSYLTALELVGTTRIGNLSDLLNYDSNEEEYCITGKIEKLNPNQQLKRKLKASFLDRQNGTTFESIQNLLQVRSVEKFRKLSSEITDYIFSEDKEKKGLTDNINKPIEEYSVGESIVLASYFARNVITKYKKLEDCVEDIFTGKQNSEVCGKCTDYTGLALHYLREYLVPLQPDKFRNWTFGYDSDQIGDYKHCYIKAMHIDQNSFIDVYFLDPTSLASRGIDELITPEIIIEDLNTDNLPLLIQRDAEDLLYAVKEKMKD